MKKYVVMALVVLVGGCTTYWSHPVKSDLELVHDAAYCEALGGAAAHGMMSDKYWLMFVDVARQVTTQQVLARCMERRGWAKASAGMPHRSCDTPAPTPGPDHPHTPSQWLWKHPPPHTRDERHTPP